MDNKYRREEEIMSPNNLIFIFNKKPQINHLLIPTKFCNVNFLFRKYFLINIFLS